MRLKAPEGYSYRSEDFNTKFKRIMLVHHYPYVYAEGKQVETVWGFINKKTGDLHAPINAQKPGNIVDKTKVTPYTTMPILQPLRAS